MTGRVEGKVAFITGAARGQGRSHAVRLAAEGADIIAVDICAQVDSVAYPLATPDDLAQTAKEVEALGRRIVATQADVRDYTGLKKAMDDGVAQLGRLDIVCPNAGIFSTGLAADLEETTWRDVIDTNLTGMWHACKAAIPHLVEGGRGGSIVIISSTGGLKGIPGAAHYSSAKHGVVGLMRTLALELAPHFIRVNSVHTSTVNTDIVQNETFYRLAAPGLDNPGRQDMAVASQAMNALPLPWMEPTDVSDTVLFLASDEARYITGVTLPVDAGFMLK
jgi:(+)-trans-carveol dehydrogenase